MKYHFTGFATSALFHIALVAVVLPLLLWQDVLEKPAVPQPVTLSLTQFQPAPAPPVESPPPPAPEPVPVKPQPPKPVEKPLPKPPEKPKPPKKVVEKPTPKPPPKPETKPEVTPPPTPQPAVVTPDPVVTPPPRPVMPAQAPVAAVAKPTPAPVPVNNGAAEAAYRAKLQRLIAARKQYPRMAEQAEIEGVVTVAFTLSADGTVMGARVSQSSGNEWLDKAALQAVNAVSGALPFPPDIHKARWDFSLKVTFTLE